MVFITDLPPVNRKKFPTTEEQMKQLIKDREEALAAHKLAHACMMEQQKSNFIPFKVGDEVWLDSRNLKTIYHKKMAPKLEGPFKIMPVSGLPTTPTRTYVQTVIRPKYTGLLLFRHPIRLEPQI
jgi:hypothetical protein